jgi:dTDP-4-dehydrorhamnose reductase
VLEAPAFPIGILHATSEGYTNWFELASTFLKAMQVPHEIGPCTTAEYPTPARRPQCAILENAALKALGLNVMVDWRADLLDFVQRHRVALLAEAQAYVPR